MSVNTAISYESVIPMNSNLMKREAKQARADITHYFVVLTGLGLMTLFILTQVPHGSWERKLLISTLFLDLVGFIGCLIASAHVLVDRNHDKSTFIRVGHVIFHCVLICLAFVPMLVLRSLV